VAGCTTVDVVGTLEKMRENYLTAKLKSALFEVMNIQKCLPKFISTLSLKGNRLTIQKSKKRLNCQPKSTAQHQLC
jgi:uncharacterized OsmC-like protein